MPNIPYDERRCRALERIADALEDILTALSDRTPPPVVQASTLAKAAVEAGIKLPHVKTIKIPVVAQAAKLMEKPHAPTKIAKATLRSK
jgi:hypothetical protein